MLPSLSAARLDDSHALLRAWPEALRSLPGGWLRRLYDGEALPYLSVVRCLDAVQFDSERAAPYAWAKTAELRELTTLRLYDEAMGDAGAEAFARSPHLTRVADLRLSTHITDRGALALAASENLAPVQRLDLQRNQLTARGVEALVRSPRLGRLRALHLSRNPLDLQAAEALSEHTFSLSLLDLDGARLDGGMLRVLCEAGSLTGLRALNLSNNPIDHAGWEALAACPDLESMEHLFLHACGLDDLDLERLLQNKALRGLRNLALSQNTLTEQGVTLLTESGLLSNLYELDVCHNPFSAEEAERRLRAAPALRGLRRLCV